MFHIAKEDMIVYKRVYELPPGQLIPKSGDETVVITLRIPQGTKYYAGFEEGLNKCRAAYAVVLKTPATDRLYVSLWESGLHSKNGGRQPFYYTEGKTVEPRSGFSRRSHCCESGIHFFKTEEEAKNYKI